VLLPDDLIPIRGTPFAVEGLGHGLVSLSFRLFWIHSGNRLECNMKNSNDSIQLNPKANH
jgi:hypothetical protein